MMGRSRGVGGENSGDGKGGHVREARWDQQECKHVLIFSGERLQWHMSVPENKAKTMHMQRWRRRVPFMASLYIVGVVGYRFLLS